MTHLKILSALGATALLASPVAAPAQDEPLSVAVPVADLNLLTDAGVERLDRRIKAAVTKVCGGRIPNNVIDGPPMRECHRDTLASVQPKRTYVITIARAGSPTRVASLDVTRATRR